MLEVPGSIPAGGEENLSVRTCFPSCLCRNDMIQCAVLRIETLTGGPLCRDSHPLRRLKIPTQVSCARGPGFDPRRRREKICWSELASLSVICRNDMIQCVVLRIETLTGGPLCRDSHPLCRLKIPTQVLSSCM